jgi:hypothetical protein
VSTWTVRLNAALGLVASNNREAHELVYAFSRMAHGAPASPIPTLAEAIARDSPYARSALSAQHGRGGAMKENRQVSRSVACFDIAYIRWRTKFASFEVKCFNAVCEFVRAQFDDLIERYYQEGHHSLNDFPTWAFERYLREASP